MAQQLATLVRRLPQDAISPVRFRCRCTPVAWMIHFNEHWAEPFDVVVRAANLARLVAVDGLAGHEVADLFAPCPTAKLIYLELRLFDAGPTIFRSEGPGWFRIY